MVLHLICCCGWNNSISLFVEWSRIVVHQCYWMCPGPMCWSVVTCVIRCHSNISQSQDTGQWSKGWPQYSCSVAVFTWSSLTGNGSCPRGQLWDNNWIAGGGGGGGGGGSWCPGNCQTLIMGGVSDCQWLDAAISFWEINNFKGTIRVSTTDTVPYHIYLIEQIFYQLHSQTLNSHQLFVGISSLRREIISRRCDKKQMEFQLLIWKSMLGAPTSIRTRASKPFQCQKWWIGLEKKQVRAFKM